MPLKSPKYTDTPATTGFPSVYPNKFFPAKGMVSRLLSNRLLVIGGEISYSFYLIHLLYCSLMLNGKKKATFI